MVQCRLAVPVAALLTAQASSNGLPYMRHALTMADVTPAMVTAAFHSAGVGMRHLGYAAHLASYNNRWV